MVNQLIEILGREALLFESFLELLEKQKTALVENDLDSLKSVTSQQQVLMSHSCELSDQRETVIEQLRQENNINEDLTVSKLLATVDEDRAGKLAQLRDTILSLNDKIIQTRNTNAMLLNQSRQFISKTMSALSRINNPEVTYNMGKDRKNIRSHMVVDRRV